MRRVCAAEGLRVTFAGGDDQAGRFDVVKDVLGEMTTPAAFSGSFMVLATGCSRRVGFTWNSMGKARRGVSVVFGRV